MTRICPLTDEQIVNVVIEFVALYNRPRIKLYGYQLRFMRRIIRSLINNVYDNKVITGLWSRQSGKSEAISSLASGLAIFLPTLAKAFPDDGRLSQYLDGVWIGIFAPKLKQSTIIFERVRARAVRQHAMDIYSDPDIQIQVTANRGETVAWSNGSFVTAQTASEQSNSEGKTYHLVIIDEAQYVSNAKVAKEIQPMLAATNGTMVKIGTAHISYGGFRNSILHNLKEEQDGVTAKGLPAEQNHFEFPYDRVIAEKRAKYEEEEKAYLAGKGDPPDPFHLNYEMWVQGELSRLGGNIDNDEFAMNFRLIWKDINVGAVDLGAFDNAADESLEMNRPSFRNRQVAGLDYGKKNDSTVLTVYEIDPNPVAPRAALVRGGDEAPTYKRKRIIAWLELQGRWEQQLSTIVKFLEPYRVDTVVADGTSLGDPLTERLGELLPGVNVTPYPFSDKSKDILYTYYFQELEAGRISYASGEKTRQTVEYQQFTHQHKALGKVWHGQFMSCAAPEGEHDDYCDSAALGCWATTFEPMDDVECSVNPVYATEVTRTRNTTARADRYR